MKGYILDIAGSCFDKILTWLSEDTTIKEVIVMKSPDMFLERVKREQPDMVFICMPTPIRVLSHLLEEFPWIKITICTASRKRHLNKLVVW